MADWTDETRRAAVAAVTAVQSFAGALADHGVDPAQIAIQLHSVANVVVFTAVLGIEP